MGGEVILRSAIRMNRFKNLEIFGEENLSPRRREDGRQGKLLRSFTRDGTKLHCWNRERK